MRKYKVTIKPEVDFQLKKDFLKKLYIMKKQESDLKKAGVKIERTRSRDSMVRRVRNLLKTGYFITMECKTNCGVISKTLPARPTAYMNDLIDLKDNIIMDLKMRRFKSRQEITNVINFKGVTHKVKLQSNEPRVFTEFGTFLKICKKVKILQKRKMLIISKKPKTLDFHIGVEIECILGVKEFQVFKKEVLKRNLEHCIEIGKDASIQCSKNQQGVEIKVLNTFKNIKNTISEVCSLLNKIGASVNPSCGLHVHLDMRSFNVFRAYDNLFKSLPLLTKIVAKHRLENRFCEINKELDPRELTTRYYAINFKSYKTLQTLEVRLHEGTFNPNEIINFINLLHAILKCDLSFEVSLDINNFSKFQEFDDLNEYIYNKITAA